MLRSFLYGAKPGAVLKMQPIRSLLIDTDVFVPVHNAFPKANIFYPFFFLAEELGRGAFASLRRKLLYFRVRLLPDFRSSSVFGARRRIQGAFYLFPSCVSSCFLVICPFAARFLRSFASHPRRRFCLSKNFSFYVLPPAFFILQKSSRCFLFSGKEGDLASIFRALFGN